MLFTIKQVASVSHQLGRRAFCEAYGVSGWDSTFEHYKRFGDWLHGARHRFHGPAPGLLHRARRAQARPSAELHRRLALVAVLPAARRPPGARELYALARQPPQNRLLLLEPTTSGFLWARRAGAPRRNSTRMRQSNGALIQFLADHQVDFDLGDEYIIEWFGRQDGQKFVLGKASYDLLVWPEHMVQSPAPDAAPSGKLPRRRR